MATKGKTTKKSPETVIRVSAKETTPVKTAKKQKATSKPTVDTTSTQTKNPFVAMGGYFKGAWQELKQVRWPNRQATWSMTAALLAFTAFFVALILLLDALFKYMFQLILG